MATWQDLLVLAISTIGFLSLSKPIFKFLKWVYCMFLRPPKTLTTYGSWALITGCTDGIGKALTFDLASQGLNLVLVARNPNKLESTSNEIRDKFEQKQIKTQIKIIVIDFEKASGEEIERKIRREIEGLDVGVLVNNVGLGSTGPIFFHENSLEFLESILKVNIEGVNWVTKAVIPGMLKRKKGFIVNIGSGSSVVVPSFPFAAIYAATKAYVAMLSRCLSVEYKEHGINMQCQVPLFVATKMISNTMDRTLFFVPSPEDYSRASVKWIGHDSVICIPYLGHAYQAYLVSLVPDSVVNWVIFRLKYRLRNKLLLQEDSAKPLLNQKH